MNFIPVTIENGRVAKADGLEFELPRPVNVKKAVLGIRPEALSERHRDGNMTVEMIVDVVEVLGSDLFLYGMCGGLSLAARVEPTLNVAAGDRVTLSLGHRHMHLFDPETGQSITDLK